METNWNESNCISECKRKKGSNNNNNGSSAQRKMVTFIELKCVRVSEWVCIPTPLLLLVIRCSISIFYFGFGHYYTFQHFKLRAHTYCMNAVCECVHASVSARAVNAFLLNCKFYRVENKHTERDTHFELNLQWHGKRCHFSGEAIIMLSFLQTMQRLHPKINLTKLIAKSFRPENIY